MKYAYTKWQNFMYNWGDPFIGATKAALLVGIVFTAICVAAWLMGFHVRWF